VSAEHPAAHTSGGNYIPTEETVCAKIERGGALFASDEVEALLHIITRLRVERAEMLATIRELQRKYVRTESA
jgi:hypothetical protein